MNAVAAAAVWEKRMPCSRWRSASKIPAALLKVQTESPIHTLFTSTSPGTQQPPSKANSLLARFPPPPSFLPLFLLSLSPSLSLSPGASLHARSFYAAACRRVKDRSTVSSLFAWTLPAGGRDEAPRNLMQGGDFKKPATVPPPSPWLYRVFAMRGKNKKKSGGGGGGGGD